MPTTSSCASVHARRSPLWLLLFLLSGALGAADPLPITTSEVVTGGLALPIAVTAAPGDTTRVFVAEQHTGQVRIVALPSGTISSTPFLTESGVTGGNEQGLLGLAFHPNFAANGWVYINCTKTGGGAAGHTEVVRYTARSPFASATSVDPATRTVVLSFDQPEDNHNGGWLGFGPDGFLYISAGDGGGAGDLNHGPVGSGQDLGTLLGKILRLDVATQPYGIPAGNLSGTGVRGEIFAYGLRNPWRCSFDRTTGDLWIGDVGQSAREEIDVIPAGRTGLNFGWRRFEGTRLNDSNTPLANGSVATAPVADYGRDVGASVIGGYVYRGQAIPALRGAYLYGDYVSGRFFTVPAAQGVAGTAVVPTECTSQIDRTGRVGSPSALGEDALGEIYICDHGNGRLHKIVTDLAVTTASTIAATTVGVAVTTNFTAQGGTGAKTWAVTNGSLPAGITLSTTGQLSGSATAAGNAMFTVRVTDAAGARASRDCTWQINPLIAITTAATLPSTSIGQNYRTTLTATGGTGTLTWSVSAGALPAGLVLRATGELEGIVNTAGTETFTVRVTDAVGAVTTREMTLTVTGGLAISTRQLAATTVGATYRQTLTAIGGSKPYRWAIASGSLPAGLTLAADTGVISGSPTTAGVATATVRVTDQANVSVSRSLTLTVNPVLAITTASAPPAHVGVPYELRLASTGGTPPITWRIGAGEQLPPGLIMSVAGVVSGTPTTAQSPTWTAIATDAAGVVASRELSVMVEASPAFFSQPILTANVGLPYRYDVDAGGEPMPTYTLQSGPSGMTIDPTSGVITWVPVTAGAQQVVVVADNGKTPTAQQRFTITVIAAGLVTRPLAVPYLGMPNSPSAGLPARLSDTGAFSAGRPAPAMIPYSVNVPFWSDGALKQRWVSVPNDGAPYATNESVTYDPHEAWGFPDGTVFMKQFDLVTDERTPRATRRLETRLLVTTTTGIYGVTYRWNAAQTEAIAVTTGASENITITAADGSQRIQRWSYPSPIDCLQCHNRNAGYVLGLSTRQLNRTFAYPATGVSENQLTAWNRVGLFSHPESDSALLAAERLRALDDPQASLQQKARSYIDSNCTACHLPGGAPANFDARWSTPLASQGLINGAVNDQLGIAGARVIVPGDLARSVLYQRIPTVANYQMPPLSRNEIDARGTALIADWIASLDDSTLAITTTATVTASVGVPVSIGLDASGGTPPYTWSVISGSLPVGITLDLDGVMFGTPSVAGLSSATIQVMDSTGATATQNLTWTVDDQLIMTSPPVLPAGAAGLPYQYAFTANGGSDPRTWSVTNGVIPPGLTLNQTTGVLNGTPSVVNSWVFTVRVTDATLVYAEREFSLAVTTDPALPPPSTENSDSGGGCGMGSMTAILLGIAWLGLRRRRSS